MIHYQGEPLVHISRYALKQPFIITCKECKMSFRVENLTPYMMAKRSWFCPACGSKHVHMRSNHEDDVWYSMARSFNLEANQDTVKLLKDMYSLWDPQEFEWFKDFVQDMITGAANMITESKNNE